MNGPESKPCPWPIRSPSLSSAPPRDAAASAAKCQARGEDTGRRAFRTESGGWGASSARMCVQRCLGELAYPVALMGLGPRSAALTHERRERRDRPAVVEPYGIED